VCWCSVESASSGWTDVILLLLLPCVGAGACTEVYASLCGLGGVGGVWVRGTEGEEEEELHQSSQMRLIRRNINTLGEGAGQRHGGPGHTAAYWDDMPLH
jgi:hypothetical protein